MIQYPCGVSFGNVIVLHVIIALGFHSHTRAGLVPNRLLEMEPVLESEPIREEIYKCSEREGESI